MSGAAVAEPAVAAEPKSYKVGCKGRGDQNWAYNGLRFKTKAEAEAYGSDLFARWTALDKYEVQPERRRAESVDVRHRSLRGEAEAVIRQPWRDGMRKKPEYYKVPLRKRADITEFILSNTSQRSYNFASHPLCFNVKCGSTDPSFDHLLELWQKYNGKEYDADWVAIARERFADVDENTLWEWGVEEAQSCFCGPNRGDAFKMLWDGTPVDVEYSFEGHSSGWLSINNFEGYEFTRRDNGNINDHLADMDMSTLRNLYQLVVMLKHDTEHPEKEVEHQASFQFFANMCHDCGREAAMRRGPEYAI